MWCNKTHNILTLSRFINNIELQWSFNVIMNDSTGIMAPKHNSTLFILIGRGHTSARLRFWHDVCPYDPTKLSACQSTKQQVNIIKLT